MNHRYIQRFRLPERQYTASAPVVLAAGALLEDTKVPRLVAQLKFKSLSPKPIAALRGTIHCLDGEGRDAGTAPFSHENLTAQRGQSFGQYTAIVLPGDSAQQFTATVSTVTFGDGTVWTAPENAVWEALPGFVPLESTIDDSALLALSRQGLPKGKYAYAAPADLWYCTCGGVNHSGKCHRCGKMQAHVAQYADGAQLAALHQARLDEAARRELEQERARQEAQAKTAVRKATAEEKAAQLKEHLTKKPGQDGEEAEKPTAGKKKPILAAVLGLVAVAAVIAVVILLPKFTGDNTQLSAAGPGPAVETPAPATSAGTSEDDYSEIIENIHVTTPGDLGKTAYMDITVDEDGQSHVTRDMMVATFPETIFFSVGRTPLGNDIDDYLIDGYHMACLIGTRGERGGDDQYFSFSAKIRFQSLLLFDAKNHLFAYAIGAPEDRGGGVIRFHFTLCDHDFSALVQQQSAAYFGSEALPYVAPEDKDSCGAVWYLNGYNMGSTLPESQDRQMYHIWSQLGSPYLERFARDMSQFEMPRQNSDRIRYTCYLLLDKDYQLIGYTMLTSGNGTVAPAV